MRFYLFDSVLEIERGRRMHAAKLVNLMDGYFDGHFAGKPVVPATMIVEAMAQAAGMLNTYNHDFAVEMVLMLVDDVQLRRQVSQGELLQLEITMLYDHPYGATMKGIARVGEELVGSAERIVFAHESTTDAAKIARARARFLYQAGQAPGVEGEE